jgi:hypothetical protein
MFKKVFIAALFVTIVGAIGVAVYDSENPGSVQAQSGTPTPEPAATLPAVTTAAAAPQMSTTGVEAAAVLKQGPQVGEPWATSGVIVGVDDFGFSLSVDGVGDSIYVELGPTAYWQAQGMTLAVGEWASVQGFTQDGLYHAGVVTKTDGSQIVMRDLITGQPLWSGGVVNSQSQNGNGLQDGSGVPQPQAQVSPDEWITVEGMITAMAQNTLTVQTTDGAVYVLSLGRSGFAAEQDVPFAIGDQVKVIGYDNNGQFRAGEIDNLTQGGRLMLLDPNGRPLWAGPGGNGNGGAANSQSQTGSTSSGQGGKGYRGGRGS